jgi:7-cyano-7-deazaguanine reductase
MTGPNPLSGSALGKPGQHTEQYAPGLLFAVARAPYRDALGLGGSLPFRGVDLWTAYELSWLDRRGKPQVAIARIAVPAQSPSIVESKSLKLYLASFSQSAFDDAGSVRAAIAGDLARVTRAAVDVDVLSGARMRELVLREWKGESIDDIAVDIDVYEPDAALLRTAGGDGVVEETLVSDVLKSNCPVTGQPDWGSLQVRYRGPRIDRASLLRYVVSFRTHCAFHEHCIERIWCDIKRVCEPEALAVYGRYLRRGGIEINPYRTDTGESAPMAVRLARQ